MSTNFYERLPGYYDNPESEDYEVHIGKRSAAGRYCWTCGVTLCKGGEKGVHYSESGWYGECPQCGGKSVDESLEESSAGRELGFNKNPPQRKTGVSSCCSFSWAMKPNKVGRCKNIFDEYGREYTQEEFREVLKECPIMYYDSIGSRFC